MSWASNTYNDPQYERRALLARVGGGHVGAVCVRRASIDAALQLQREGRIVARWEGDALVCKSPCAGPFGPPELVA